MKLKDFPQFSRELIRFNCTELVTEWVIGEVVEIYSQDEGYLIRQGDIVCYATAHRNNALVELLVTRSSTLWKLIHSHNSTLELQWLELVEQLEMSVELAVDQAIVDYLFQRKEIELSDMKLALEWLDEHFVVSVSQYVGQIFLGSFENTAKNDLLIFGAGWRATITRLQNEDTWKLQSLNRFLSKVERISSIVGKVIFYDGSVDTYLKSEEQRAKINTLLQGNGSYLQQWQEYGLLEWEASKRIAQLLGSIYYREIIAVDGEQFAWLLKIDQHSEMRDFQKRWYELGLSTDTYVELAKEAQSFDIEEKIDRKSNSEDRPLRGKIQFEKHGIKLTPNQDRRNDKPPIKGYLFYSLAGDETVKVRRARAKLSIDNHRRMPQLRYLLEGVPVPVTTRRYFARGLSPYAKACFKGAPTERQKTALDIALNTPDIALIVGPPGTGKTQVIAALERRLAETLKEETLQHQVLISSYQHDAVDNALNRAEVFGLPAVRVGGKNRGYEGGVDPVKLWCQRKSAEIQIQLTSQSEFDPVSKPLVELSKRLVVFRLAKMRAEERLQEILSIDKLLKEFTKYKVGLPRSVQEKWDSYVSRESMSITTRITPDPDSVMRSVRALRSTTIGFADDGADRVYHLSRVIARKNIVLTDSDKILLNDLSMSKDPSSDQLAALTKLKNSLLDRLLPDYRPLSLKQSLPQDIRCLLDEVEQALEVSVKQSRHGIYSVMTRYQSALLNSPDRAQGAVRDYATIVGATCQQSAGKAMSSLKSISDLEAWEEIEFNTVVIDEAARANPLDLFVPMAMAKKRIILVGDHRQLPHILEPELESELQSKLSLSEEQILAHRQSLFERLLIQLRQQESLDNIRRVVMLNTQYRMHPILGDFISQQFYESEGLDKLYSGRPASDFEHNLLGYKGKVCAWLNVPYEDGSESSHRPGYSRRVEAETIASEVKKLADAGGESLSIGVISFYRAQTDAILKALVNQGIAEEEDGDIKIMKDYRQTSLGEERLRVGTVDAFQGKEFDVVLLSIVRSNDRQISSSLSADLREKYLNAKYGHLRLSNRMNVAMSRQRKLLIAVGDQRMAQGAEAEEAVPSLAAFLTLCSREKSRVH